MSTKFAVLTEEELSEMIRQTASAIVTDLYDKLVPQPTPEIMDKEQLANYLRCSGRPYIDI